MRQRPKKFKGIEMHFLNSNQLMSTCIRHCRTRTVMEILIDARDEGGKGNLIAIKTQQLWEISCLSKNFQLYERGARMIAITVLLPARCMHASSSKISTLTFLRRDGFPFFQLPFNSRVRTRGLSNANKCNWQHSYCDGRLNQVNTELSFLFTSYIYCGVARRWKNWIAMPDLLNKTHKARDTHEN